MTTRRLAASALLISLLAAAAPGAARPGGWGSPGWGSPRWGSPGWGSPTYGGWGQSRQSDRDDREGRVDSDQFMADGVADQLGHGPVIVAEAAGGTADARDQAAYEAAVVDQLIKAGYDTAKPDPEGGQVVELRIVRDVLVPEEQKRKPVSGEVSVGTGTYGSSVGMAVALDFTKPKKALVSTRMELRLKDRATGKALWEGHAQIATREDDSHWSDQAIATRLAAALFSHFPEGATRVASR